MTDVKTQVETITEDISRARRIIETIDTMNQQEYYYWMAFHANQLVVCARKLERYASNLLMDE